MTGYLQQPLLDFRPYKTGQPLIPESNDEEDESFIFIYERDGVMKEFSETDTLPSGGGRMEICGAPRHNTG